MLLVKPEPVPSNYHDNRWSWFQGRMCLFITQQLTDHSIGQGRVRLPQILEGSATDSRILRDAILRPDGLIVPHGMF
ncbi:hypothetical protein RHMOL_Rhmol01G0200100 [Rhododendron molle]|nr:hypothetical protein RHMOL_Rhmol01G0200100 [Rhododendron molle]